MIQREYLVDDYVMVGGKRFALNLNTYRNAHHMILNKAKINFKNELLLTYPELLKLKFNKVKITYIIIPHDKQLFDTKNIESIVDKFFCDALVESGIIPDDSYTYVSYGAPEVSEIVKNKCKKILIKCEFS